ncbi:MAG: NAD-dependent epimerase/dehydratase family protein, partial [Gemmatimonadales bacterium]
MTKKALSATRHVLITGGAGYIGTVLTELLLERGDKVTVLDRFFFGDTLGDLTKNRRLRLVRDDVRWSPKAVFKGVDAVCDLAALSNDPAGELNPEKTLEINHQGRARICKLAKAAGVKRYVLASSCSIYGFQDEVVDETSAINPLTTYAVANRKAEESAFRLGSDKFVVTALRQATVYGLSRRMRFDLAINGMTLALHKNGKVRILRDGKQWRPMIHIRDTSRAFIAVLEADPAKVNGEIFNAGADNQNLQIQPLAQRLCTALGLPYIEDWYGDPDHRSYQVSFKKIGQRLG